MCTDIPEIMNRFERTEITIDNEVKIISESSSRAEGDIEAHRTLAPFSTGSYGPVGDNATLKGL
ncbi:hypothetical protein KHC33_13790 [Methanospirillum sp. J.3.6.1-F.2.7.3]|jgi:hypothetical protein|uniref:Uncharacterized protein n=1 Tax=Methanospirillum purgamenti TaxID=2834276 RepID=A0A8E7B141_9EURY|nr:MULTISPECIES: hypothetical protein [Methanospirillum]MDX8551811.1 hypothetical protein [Methanospirillum hungatei]QVV88386.1 hypothetical protein KHC33_13790 [Methanospirillum sp. J.3.6.1-F.2.7.3]